ncbi:hypothetical protein BDV3_005657 [Batrachochytrium dendrobatidis]|nr:valine--tRNA ligase [Batrachochytrium dendrobatidis]KAK5673468.1 valine--tRNA ligase [Batrachochytrium dendrobatidis]
MRFGSFHLRPIKYPFHYSQHRLLLSYTIGSNSKYFTTLLNSHQYSYIPASIFGSNRHSTLSTPKALEQPKIMTDPAAATLSGESTTKSKNEAKNEAKRLEKLAKFQAKQAKQAATEKAPKKTAEPKTAAPAAKEIEPFVNLTPKGEKKDMAAPMASSYNPKAVEAAWYDWWEKEGYFKPELKPDGTAKDEGTFVVPIPPPNVTGSLHIGHALTNAIQDAMIRWNRMQGKTTLWVPGADHAGISTQVVVEKKIMRERGITRHQLGRDAFLEEVFKWKDVNIHNIYNQLRRMGSSFDWTRDHFTMDAGLSNAVKEAFVQMHEDGTIYRANRLVNWCTKLKTALSNLEVENKELDGSTFMTVPDHDPSKTYEFGVLISFAYQIENSDERIVVATTRLETMLGDTAIAVHPSDKRYQHLHGKYAIHPFQNRRIPILPDEYPDPEFGTGAVKITPAHDANDYMVGQRQKLENITIFTDDGKINENGAPFTGLQRFDARAAVLAALKEKNLYVGTESNKQVLPICTRSGNIIEPLLKPQWWVNCQEMAGQAMDAVRNGDMKIAPALSEREWFRWLDNIQDWCISRQLWWGHRVPAYFVCIDGDENDRDDSNRWVSGRSEDEARIKAIKKFETVDPAKITLFQDEDVLDTWFSSGLWPFSIMGWPAKTKDMELYFPNTLLETGWDILFFWVARMVMMSLKFNGVVPFKQVFCHAMIRDAHGRKMSKSLGNVIDPIDVIEGVTLQLLQERLEKGNLDPRELVRARDGQKKDFPNGIPECGTDALRFGLLAYSASGRDINLDILRVDGYRKFCNKLWNATRFALLKLGEDYKPRATHNQLTGKESVVDLWILAKLNKAIAETNTSMEQMNFMQATTGMYQFWLHELCDVYLEVCKPVIDGEDIQAKEAAQDVLYICLEQGLKLLHPVMPFVTEELYQRLPRRAGDAPHTIMKAKFPTTLSIWENSTAEFDFEVTNEVIRGIRSLMTEYNIRSNATIYVSASNEHLRTVVDSQQTIIKSLAKGIKVFETVAVNGQAPAGCVVSTQSNTTVYLLVKGQIDFDAEIAKLNARISKVLQIHKGLSAVMAGDGYASRVKPEVKESDALKLKGYETDMSTLQAAVDNFVLLKST